MRRVWTEEATTRRASVVVIATVSQRCPDLAKVDELAAFDLQRVCPVTRCTDKSAAALAAMEINTLADKLDAEFGIACAQVAHDLGNKSGDWRNGNDRCAAAIKAGSESQITAGPKATAQLVVRQPVCLVEASLLTKCASICDSSVPAGKVRAECEQKAGCHADGSCEGACEPKARSNAKVDLQWHVEGIDQGNVRRSLHRHACDGRKVNGVGCSGVCKGRACATEGADQRGECKGQCTGSCKPSKPGICDGVCF